MKKIALLWLALFIFAAISISWTHQYLISPVWVVNAIAGYYLVRFRKHLSNPLGIFIFSFSAVFAASCGFDGTKEIETKALLSAIGAVQIQSFIWAYYAVAQRLSTVKYKNTLLLVIPNTVGAWVGGVLFMLLFKVGENYYEFVDYFLEQLTTGLAVLCILKGMYAWQSVGWKEYFYLSFASIVQYVISMDRIFYACLILPLLMCLYALKHNLREFAWLIGLLVLLCSIYVSLPMGGEYWTHADVYLLSKISAYRLSLGIYLILFLFICEMYIVNRRLYLSLERMTFQDELTALSTRRYVKKVLEHNPLGYGSGILLDVDNFKRVNDRYGHHVGDLVLVHMAKILKDVLPATAVISRWGGEEFLLLLPNFDKKACEHLCHEILMKCQRCPFEYQEESLVMTFSMGATSFNFFNLHNYSQVLQHMDTCLYQAKAEGKNRFVYA